MGLSAEQHKVRRLFIGGSDANILMGGDPKEIHRLWQVKLGLAEPEDLSNVLPVQMGSFTEPFNIAWFEKQTGFKVTNQGEQIIDETFPFRGCTLDGLTELTLEDPDPVPALFEAKHVGAFNYSIDDIITRYFPQLQHGMDVLGLDYAALSVFSGNAKWEYAVVRADREYQDQLLDVEAAFWDAVKDKKEPQLPKVEKKVFNPVRELDMTGDNAWAAAAADYRETLEAVARHEDAKKTIKSLVPDDAKRCVGHGIKATRDKRGAVTIGEI